MHEPWQKAGLMHANANVQNPSVQSTNIPTPTR
jgi:hypothetical protein